MLYIVFSSNTENLSNLASFNIAQSLLDYGFVPAGNSFYKCGNATLYDSKFFYSYLFDPSFKDASQYIVLSPHKSESNAKSLTVHTPGNWDKALFGGKPRTLSFSSASVNLSLLFYVFQISKKIGLEYSVSYEVDHHGPTSNTPIVFVEIGSTEKEWKDKLAAECIAQAIIKTIDEPLSCENFFGIGNGHYAPFFTRLSLEKNFGFAHLLPKYHINTLEKDTFSQAISKSVEEVKAVIVEKKGTTLEQREKINMLSKEFGIDVIKK